MTLPLLAAGVVLLAVVTVAAVRLEPRSLLHRSAGVFGALLTVSVALEAVTEYLLTRGKVSWWAEAAGWAVGMLLALSLTWLASTYAGISCPRWSRILHGVVYGMLAAGSFTPWGLVHVSLLSGPTPQKAITNGPLVVAQVAGAVWAMALSVFLLARAFLRARPGSERRRLKVVLVGLATSAGLVTALLLAVVCGRPDLGALLWAGTLPFVASLLVAAGRYGAFDVSGAARQAALALLRLVVGLALLAGLVKVVDQFDPRVGLLSDAESLALRALVVGVVFLVDKAFIAFAGPILDKRGNARKRALADLAVALSSVADRQGIEQRAAAVVAAQIPGAGLRLVSDPSALKAAAAVAEVGGAVDLARLGGDGRLAPHRLALEALLSVLDARAIAVAGHSGRAQALLVLTAPAHVSIGHAELAFLADLAEIVAGPLVRGSLMEHVVRLNAELSEANLELERRVRERTAELAREHQHAVDAERRLARQDRLASIGQLAAGVAHEINNPLAVVIQNLRTLRSMFGDPACAAEEARELFDAAEQSTERIKTIVRDLGRAAATAEAPRVPVDLKALVASEIERVRREAMPEKTGVTLEAELEDVGQVAVSSEDVAHAVGNLVKNGLAADSSRVVVRLRRDGRRAVIQVTDDGRGIPREAQRRLFDPFGKLGAVGEGRGLGLAVVAGIARRHGASLEVTSVPGEGATFEFSLPIERA